MLPVCVLLFSDESSAVFSAENQYLRIAAVNGKIVRITVSRSTAFLLSDHGVLEPVGSAPLSCTESAEGWLLDAGQMQIHVSRRGILSYYHGEELLTEEPFVRSRVLRSKDVIVMDYPADAPLQEEHSVDGVRVRAQGVPRFDRKAYSAMLHFSFQEGEAIYGLGQHEDGVLNYRGRHQMMYQHNLTVSCPVLMSSRGWGLLINCLSAMTFHDDAYGSYFSMDTVDELDYFIGYGPELDDLVGMMRLLTGPARLLPRWVFGYIQSTECYNTQQELLDIAREYRRRGVPLDCVVQDWQTWRKGQWGQKTVDPERYPDLSAGIQALHDENVKLFWSIWPNMGGDGENRREMISKGYMLGNRSSYNAFDPAARDVYWRQAEEGLFRHGVDGWWCDCTEPFERDWNGEPHLTPEERMCLNVDEFKRYLDPALINAYSYFHSKGIYEHQRAVCESKRVVNLTRSGFPGQQKYATITWNGDTSARWDVLAKAIPDGLNFCLSGQPYWSQDAGGFFVRRGAQWFRDADFDEGVHDPGYRELYLRWLQVCCFQPMMRSHGTDTPREIWQFGESGEEIYDALASTIRLRYRLLPYLYTLAAGASLEGGSIIRMLAFDYRHDPIALNIGDQFLLGRNLMVCPVLFPTRYTEGGVPVENAPATRRVYLPSGTDWADFETGERFSGGQWIDAPVRLDRIPVYAPVGSVIPLGPNRQYADEDPTAPVQVHIFAGRNGEAVFYNDAGDGYGYEEGEFYRARLIWDDAKRQLTVEDSGEIRFKPRSIDVRIL